MKNYKLINKAYPWISLIFFFSFCKSSKLAPIDRGKIYYFSFGCCFKNDSVIVKDDKVIYFDGIVNTNENIGIDKNSSFTIPSSNSKKQVQVLVVQKKKTIIINIDPIAFNKFIGIYLYKDSLYYNESEKFLRGE